MSLMMLLVWGVPIVLVAWLVRGNLRPGQSAGTTLPGSGAERLLAERYARGEIDEDEFTRRRDVLRTGPKAS
jgi:putative membrane protein